MHDSLTVLKAPEGAEYLSLNFGQAFLDVAKQAPDKIAIIDETGQHSWASLSNLAGSVAARLIREGVEPGQRIAALADNSADYVALYCGVLLAGACMAPLPTSAQSDALGKMLADCDAKLLFASDAYWDVAQGLGAAPVVALSPLSDWAVDAPIADPVEVSPETYFDLIYSSGTTGTPKGIIHDHQFRGRQLERMPLFGLDGDACLIMSTPLYSNTTLVAVLPVLAKGGTVVSMRKFDVTRFLELSQEHAVTHAMLVPVQYMRLMKAPDFDSYDLSSYRAKLSTSAPLPAPLIRDIVARWPGEQFEVYGMTEGGVTTILDCRSFPDKLDTVGRLAEGCHVHVIDENGVVLPEGSYGEIVGRAGSMMPGYLNAEQSTRDVVWRDAQGRDYIRTGDMGRFDEDGFLHLLDRKKDMIISGGFNIYAADLERVLRDHPDVADVAVIAVPSEQWGETPLGLVVLDEAAQSTAQMICDWANERLGKFQRLSRIEPRASLPRNAIGKIDKRGLRAVFWPQPDKSGPH